MTTPYILVLYYSRTGSVEALAQAIARGVESAGFEARLRTVPPVSTVAEATKPSIPDSGDLYCTNEDLAGCSGLIMGSPGRFGNMAAPLKYFLETTGDIWLSGALIDKPAAVFTSTASMHGGQEATLLSMMTPLLHHGLIITGVPYSQPILNETTTGGTPYGASHVSGSHNDPTLNSDETAIALTLGQRVANIARSLSQ